MNVTKPKLKFKTYQLQNEKNCDLFRETILVHLKRNNLISGSILPTLHTAPKLSNISDQNCSFSYVKIFYEIIANLVSDSNDLEAKFNAIQDTKLNEAFAQLFFLEKEWCSLSDDQYHQYIQTIDLIRSINTRRDMNEAANRNINWSVFGEHASSGFMNIQNRKANSKSEFQTFSVKNKISKDQQIITDYISSEIGTTFSLKDTPKNLIFLEKYNLKNAIDDQLSHEMNHPISESEIKINLTKIIKKNSSGPDGAPPKLLMWIFDFSPE